MAVVPLIVCYKDRPELRESIEALNNIGLKPHVLFQNWSAEFPEGNYHRHSSAENLGCAGARNRLFVLCKDSIADEDYLLFMDDDAVLHSFDQEILEEKFDIIAAKSILLDQSIERPAIPRSFAIAPNLAGRVFRVTGVCFLIRKECFGELGGFYNYFPYGYEESDLSLKAYRAGVRIYYTPAICVVHHKQKENWTKVRMQEHEYQIVKNKMVYINRNFDLAGRLLGRFYWTCRFLIRGYALKKIAAYYFHSPTGPKLVPITIWHVLYIMLRGRLIVL